MLELSGKRVSVPWSKREKPVAAGMIVAGNHSVETNVKYKRPNHTLGSTLSKHYHKTIDQIGYCDFIVGFVASNLQLMRGSQVSYFNPAPDNDSPNLAFPQAI